jgi:probable F420-dependent oxidoreductase
MGSGLEDFPIPDPLIWLAYVASATRRIKLGTAILILPQRNPVVTAKAVATLDHLAGGGRVLLGIGVGWLAEEFATLGVPFEDRGPRTDEYVAAMRTLWRDERASFSGRFVSFTEVFCRPRPAGGGIPIIVGGDHGRRAGGRLGDATFRAARRRAVRRDAPGAEAAGPSEEPSNTMSAWPTRRVERPGSWRGWRCRSLEAPGCRAVKTPDDVLATAGRSASSIDERVQAWIADGLRLLPPPGRRWSTTPGQKKRVVTSGCRRR